MKKEQEAVHMENSGSKDFLLGAIVGGVVGAAAALFLAPKPGKELLNDMNGHANSLKGKGIELSGTLKEKGSEYITIAKEKTDQLTTAVSKQSSSMMDKMKGANSTEDLSANEDDASTENDQERMEEKFKSDYDEIQKKLDETKKAFDETESKYNHS
ncbi:YtxH domain-containing protein [Niallia nealsonii]|uniref:Gas vesicle protein n=1 Tax=Niallia nealsonii TaxID=115979 RepID=A0A2N0Z609_9BACI|nr:YtxH domain-containing protein [Niallia nealsonii]PKG24958.1 hypothetical protein CWS01_03535 [Niallia nealsonii]